MWKALSLNPAEDKDSCFPRLCGTSAQACGVAVVREGAHTVVGPARVLLGWLEPWGLWRPLRPGPSCFPADGSHQHHLQESSDEATAQDPP